MEIVLEIGEDKLLEHNDSMNNFEYWHSYNSNKRFPTLKQYKTQKSISFQFKK
jgi:hypothetical protein